MHVVIISCWNVSFIILVISFVYAVAMSRRFPLSSDGLKYQCYSVCIFMMAHVLHVLVFSLAKKVFLPPLFCMVYVLMNIVNFFTRSLKHDE